MSQPLPLIAVAPQQPSPSTQAVGKAPIRNQQSDEAPNDDAAEFAAAVGEGDVRDDAKPATEPGTPDATGEGDTQIPTANAVMGLAASVEAVPTEGEGAELDKAQTVQLPNSGNRQQATPDLLAPKLVEGEGKAQMPPPEQAKIAPTGAGVAAAKMAPVDLEGAGQVAAQVTEGEARKLATTTVGTQQATGAAAMASTQIRPNTALAASDGDAEGDRMAPRGEAIPDDVPLPERVASREATPQAPKLAATPNASNLQIATDFGQTANDGKSGLSSLDEIALGGSTSLSSALPASPTAPGAAPAQIAQHAANQIAMALPRDNGVIVTGSATEIALDPPELGRVRLIVTEVAGGLALTVTAERQETLDLFKRNAQLLAQEFLQEGLSDTQFEFREDGREDDDEPARDEAGSLFAEPAEYVSTQSPVRRVVLGSGTLDIRL